MKIERISENQIRCTLTKEDLAARHIKITELAYGTSKARLLFREMLEKASSDYGFISEDIPLMIEAIPMSSEGIVLLISKVNEPDELDTRFAEFTAYDEDVLDESILSDMDEINQLEETSLMDLFKRLYERIEGNKTTENIAPEFSDNTLLMNFTNMTDIIRLSRDFNDSFNGTSSLYRKPNGNYILILKMDVKDEADFKKFCALVTEYGKAELCMKGTLAHIHEHFDTILINNALTVLSAM